ncbi:hypothetical protein BT69DRAFT_1298427 [Atractiella rhizophila]|nr:hypothetical protein BT69DRAFT_1298427 [Atractiella rhizophila]
MLRFSAAHDETASEGTRLATMRLVPTRILLEGRPTRKGRGAWLICRKEAVEAMCRKGWFLHWKLLETQKMEKNSNLVEPEASRLIKQIQSQLVRRIWQELEALAEKRGKVLWYEKSQANNDKEPIEQTSLDLVDLLNRSDLDSILKADDGCLLSRPQGCIILLDSPMPSNLLSIPEEDEAFSTILNHTPVYSFPYLLSHSSTVFPPSTPAPETARTMDLFRQLTHSQQEWDGTAVVVKFHMRTVELLQSLWRTRLWLGEGWGHADGLGIGEWKSKNPPDMIPKIIG